MFGQPQKATSPPKPNDIHAHARREWDERYGSHIAQARQWRLTAFGALGVAAIAVGGALYDRAQNKIVPYVVQTDHLGDALAIARANVATPADPRLIRAALARWIVDTRSVFSDVPAQRQLVTEAFAHVDANSPAVSVLNEWYSRHSPFDRAKTDAVAVEVESVTTLSADTWRVEWRENTSSRDGQAATSTFWQARISVALRPPTTDAGVLANPIGLFVTSFDWTEIPSPSGWSSAR